VSEFYAVMWTVKPGTEQAVRDLFANYGRPDPVVKGEDGSELGRLLGTQVFMKDNTVVRVMEFEGEPRAIFRHLQRQEAVKDLEAKLNEYLENPRDMSSPEAAQKFFRETGMDCLLARKHDD
jgi:SchA/CurD like domain